MYDWVDGSGHGCFLFKARLDTKPRVASYLYYFLACLTMYQELRFDFCTFIRLLVSENRKISFKQ